MKNKICFVSSSFPRWDPRIFLRQAKSLVLFGFNVTYIVCDGKQDENKEGVMVLNSEFFPKNRFQRFFSGKNLLYKKAISVNADIYQISEPELISLGLKLKRLGKKVIFDMREDYPHLMLSKEYLPKFSRKCISFALSKYLNSSLQKFDLLISVTPQLVNLLKRINPETILVASFPIVRENSQITLEDYENRENTLCYIGTVYRISRQEVLFRTLEEIKNIQYIIAGRMETDYYKSELQSLPYWGKVKFTDGISRDEILELYEKVTIGNSLRDFSGTGYEEGSLGVLKIFEYMEASLPIICSDVKLWKEIVDKYKCGIYVNPNNEEEIKNAIHYLIDNKKEAFEMGQNARKAITEEFNWGTQEVKYIKVINSLLI